MSDPRGLASVLHDVASVTTQLSRTVGRGDTLTLQLAQTGSAIDLANAMVAVDWGDGSTTVGTLTPHHAFGKTGTMTVHAMVVERGEVARLTVPVSVHAAGSGLTDQWTLPKPHAGSALAEGAAAPVPDQTGPAPQTFRLTVTKSGTGTGNVGDNSNTINCGAVCAADYPVNSVVTLAAGADVGSVFVGWSGACTGANVGCTVTMSGNVTVDAQFDKRGQACSGTDFVQGPMAGVAITCVLPFGYVRIAGPQGNQVAEAQGPSGWVATPSGNAVMFVAQTAVPTGTTAAFQVFWTVPLGGASDVSAKAGGSPTDAVAVTFP
jgi:uncharacterized repeat protein (TIGR02543 family)